MRNQEGSELKNNIAFVRYACRTYRGRPDYEDIFQEACIAFVKAMRKYRAGGKASFLTYARRAILNAANSFIKSEAGTQHDSLEQVEYSAGTKDHRQIEARAAVLAALKKIKDNRAREIIRRHHGIDCQAQTTQQIGKAYNITPQAVHRIERAAFSHFQ
jgi:RNA polymerase sigma factor (sigma-70 family)